jgi:hypothetical protein
VSHAGDLKATLKVTDTTNLLFDLQVSDSILPANLRIGDVVRFSKLVRDKSSDEDKLTSQDKSNCMMLEPWYKLYQKFHSKMKNEKFDLTEAILGNGVQKIK